MFNAPVVRLFILSPIGFNVGQRDHRRRLVLISLGVFSAYSAVRCLDLYERKDNRITAESQRELRFRGE